jgi:hypothetical protein
MKSFFINMLAGGRRCSRNPPKPNFKPAATGKETKRSEQVDCDLARMMNLVLRGRGATATGSTTTIFGGSVMKLLYVRKMNAFVFGLLMLTGLSTEGLALERQTIAQGLSACYNWCDTHRSGGELTKCKANCDVYWNCQGSDSSNKTCSDAILKNMSGMAQSPGSGQNRQPFVIAPTDKSKTPSTVR